MVKRRGEWENEDRVRLQRLYLVSCAVLCKTLRSIWTSLRLGDGDALSMCSTECFMNPVE